MTNQKYNLKLKLNEAEALLEFITTQVEMLEDSKGDDTSLNSQLELLYKVQEQLNNQL